MIPALIVYLSIVLVMSIVCFVTYGWDKKRAVNGKRRVPENTLHLQAFLGGWPGGLLAQRQFHHKTKKVSFLIVFWTLVVMHITLVGSLAYAVFK